MLKFLEIKTVTNPTLDGNSRFTQSFGEFEKVVNAIISGSDGYLPHIQGISGNVVTVEVRQRGLIAHTGTAVAAHAALVHAAKAGGPQACAGAAVADHVFTQPTITHANIIAAIDDHAAKVHAAAVGGPQACAGAAVADHVFTQPTITHANIAAGIADHVVTQPNAHAVTQPNDHLPAAIQGGAPPANHTHTITLAADAAVANLVETAGVLGVAGGLLGVTGIDNAPHAYGAGANVVHAGTAVDAHAGTAVDAHAAAVGGPQACAGGAVDSHVVTQPTITHANIVAAVDDHASQTHSVTQPSDHGAAVLAAVGAGAITAVFRIMAEGL